MFTNMTQSISQVRVLQNFISIMKLTHSHTLAKTCLFLKSEGQRKITSSSNFDSFIIQRMHFHSQLRFCKFSVTIRHYKATHKINVLHYSYITPEITCFYFKFIIWFYFELCWWLCWCHGLREEKNDGKNKRQASNQNIKETSVKWDMDCSTFFFSSSMIKFSSLARFSNVVPVDKSTHTGTGVFSNRHQNNSLRYDKWWSIFLWIARNLSSGHAKLEMSTYLLTFAMPNSRATENFLKTLVIFHCFMISWCGVLELSRYKYYVLTSRVTKKWQQFHRLPKTVFQ